VKSTGERSLLEGFEKMKLLIAPSGASNGTRLVDRLGWAPGK
jgi:hypothetical protein